MRNQNKFLLHQPGLFCQNLTTFYLTDMLVQAGEEMKVKPEEEMKVQAEEKMELQAEKELRVQTVDWHWLSVDLKCLAGEKHC